jgi:YcaO-like protein with predicted kinase domain
MAPIKIFGREYAMKKGYTAGTHRARSPSETLEDYARFMPRMGITRLANLTGLDCIGLPVYTAIRPNSRSLSTSQGKGFDADSAKVSALMESIEGWHAEHIEQPLRFESYLRLRDSVSTIDVSALPLCIDTEFLADQPLQWIEGYDLAQHCPTWVPYELVSMNYVLAPDFDFTFFSSSNGLASGNHLLEGIVHGLCEVIERDAEALWRLNDDMTQVDLATVDDPCCAEVIDLITDARIHVAAWDITSDNGVPAYGCLILERPDQTTGRPVGVYTGFGCHLSPAVALMRALSEAVQSRVGFIAGSRDDTFHDRYEELTDQRRLRTIWDELSNSPCTQSFAARSSLASDSFEEDLSTLLSALKGIGLGSVAVIDLTKPEFDIPVVKVIVPGLEGVSGPDCARGKRAAEFTQAGQQ